MQHGSSSRRSYKGVFSNSRFAKTQLCREERRRYSRIINEELYGSLAESEVPIRAHRGRKHELRRVLRQEARERRVLERQLQYERVLMDLAPSS